MSDDPTSTGRSRRRRTAGETASRGALLQGHQERLMHLIRVRLHPRLRSRVDPADVVQDVYLEAAAYPDGYLTNPLLPFVPWLRSVALHKLLSLHRRHLGAAMRDATREVPLPRDDPPATASTSLSEALIDRGPQPSEAAMLAEWKDRLHDALDRLSAGDRQVLRLRHFEQLTSAEAAAVLGIHERAASKRYLRALERLRAALRRHGVEQRLLS
jgi:RNA polymerase sigma-70 factor (ECF subfamily)